MNERERQDLRQELLELHFGCHPDPDGLRARLENDPGLQSLSAEVEGEAALLSEAAQAPIDELDLTRPTPVQEPRELPKKKTGRWFVRLALAAAAVLLLAPVGLWLYQEARAAVLRSESCQIEISGPRGVPDGAPARYTIRTTDFDHELRAASLSWRVLDEQGDVQAEGQLASTGETVLELPPRLDGPRRLEVTADAGAEASSASLYLAPDAEGPLVYLTSDKPVYRPGEPVFLRGLLLDRLTLNPRQGSYRLRIVDARDQVQKEMVLQAQQGVVSPQWQVPADSAGGEYAFELRDGQNEFTVERHAFLVQRYQASRFSKRIDLDRKTYAPGESGSAEVTVTRLGEGPAEGAQVDATLLVDGEAVWAQKAELDSAGRTLFTFQLPDSVTRGEGRFVARVSDGSTIETDIEPFVVPTGRLEVAFFPEGGELVAGTTNRIYAEVTDALGRPAEARGQIVDTAGRVVAPFETSHQGRASFLLEPGRTESYTLRFEAPVAEPVALPAAKKAGITLLSSAASFGPDEPVAFETHVTGEGPWIAGVFCRGSLVGQTTFRGAGAHKLAIDVAPEASGVLRVTVFQKDLMPVAERLVHRRSSRGITIEIEPERQTIAPGDSQRLTIHTRDESGRSVSAIVGLVVTDAATRDILDEPRIGLADQAMLFADVEELEDIEDFLLSSPGAEEHIDLLLGTRGWRRFAWLKTEELIAEHGDAARRVLIREGRPQIPQVAVDSRRDPLRSTVWDLESTALDYRRFSLILWGTALVLALVGLGLRWSARRWHWSHGTRVSFGVALTMLGAASVMLFIVGEADQGFDGAAEASFADARQLNAAPVLSATGDVLLSPEDITTLLALSYAGGTDAAQFSGDDGDEGRWRFGSFDALEVEEEVIEEPDEMAERFSLGRASFWKDDVGDKNEDLRARPEQEFQNARELDRAGLLAAESTVDSPFQADFRYYVREFAHRRSNEIARLDFRETVYWNALLATDEEGRATVEFDVSDRVTTWTVAADAHGAGRLGQADASFESRLPFQLEAKLPTEVSAGDRLEIPVVVSATDPELLSAQVGVRVTDPLSSTGAPIQTVALPDGRSRVIIPIEVGVQPGPARVDLKARSGRFSDRVLTDLRVVARGFPRHDSQSGVVSESVSFDVSLPDSHQPGSLSAELKLYPSPLDDLQDGLEGILRQPSGCFEQTSSTHYPNVLALSLIQAAGIEAPAVERRAQDLLAYGTDRLSGFECSRGGFEWFGADPAHEALTAYGLLEFHDTARVYDGIDGEMITRTRRWLLDRRDGEGGFDARQDGLHSWGAPRPIVDAYLTYSLVGTGVSLSELTREIDALEKRRQVTEDAYEMSWIARCLEAAGRSETARDARQMLTAFQKSDGSVPGGTTSITASRGNDLIVETTSIAALAWSDDDEFAGQRRRAIEYLLTQRSGSGTFGATQATILALKALVRHAELDRRITSDGEIRVFVDERLVAGERVRAGQRGLLSFDKLIEHFEPGMNRVRLELTGDNEFPWAFDLRYTSDLPANGAHPPVRLTTSLGSSEVSEGATVPVKARVENVSGDGVPMAMAIIGLPAGLEVSPKVLDDLRDGGRFAFWEQAGREIVLYWRGLEPGAVHEFDIDAVARIPGRTTGPASRSYLYYTPEEIAWTAPLTITIAADGSQSGR